jgi:hypothetical protein
MRHTLGVLAFESLRPLCTNCGSTGSISIIHQSALQNKRPMNSIVRRDPQENTPYLFTARCWGIIGLGHLMASDNNLSLNSGERG